MTFEVKRLAGDDDLVKFFWEISRGLHGMTSIAAIEKAVDEATPDGVDGYQIRIEVSGTISSSVSVDEMAQIRAALAKA